MRKLVLNAKKEKVNANLLFQISNAQMTLEQEPHAETNLAEVTKVKTRILEAADEIAERSVLSDRVGNAEVAAVENVRRLSSELQRRSFADADFLDHVEINSEQVVAEEGIATDIAEIVSEILERFRLGETSQKSDRHQAGVVVD